MMLRLIPIHADRSERRPIQAECIFLIREIENRIRKLCNKADIEVKSAHDIRRTVASELFNNCVPVEIIRNYLGHSDIKMIWRYILDNHRKEETTKMILKSLENLNGLKRTQAS